MTPREWARVLEAGADALNVPPLGDLYYALRGMATELRAIDAEQATQPSKAPLEIRDGAWPERTLR